MTMHLRTIGAIAVGSSLLISGCARKEYVRGSQEPGIDSAAMSTGLDKDDIQQMLKENLNNLRAAPVMNDWRQTARQDTVADLPVRERDERAHRLAARRRS